MIRSLPLASLVSSRQNPRRVKPDREAHCQLVATIRSFGLLEPLIVRPVEGDSGRYAVIAGHRRLAALKDVHRGNGKDVKVACHIKDVDDSTAGALALTENFTQKPMHPLDEAKAFANVAETSGIDGVTATFGVTERYVRQRMKLATLAPDIAAAYREGKIDTATAEAFTAVPEERQQQIWEEMHGEPRGAQHVRNIIGHAWMDAAEALFDVATLPAHAVSTDLFGERTLVERTAFMEAQAAAITRQQAELVEEGWSDAVACPQEEFYSQSAGTSELPPDYDAKTTRKLAQLEDRRAKLQQAYDTTDESDEAAIERIQAKMDTLEEAEREIRQKGKVQYSEASKAAGKVFLVVEPGGRVRREYRLLRRKAAQATANGIADDGTGTPSVPPPPTSNDLRDPQKAAAFTHYTLAVRAALLEHPLARKRLLVMILHENVHGEALATRHSTNGVTLHARHDAFTSAAWNDLVARHQKIDPLHDAGTLLDYEAYEKLSGLSPAKLDALIDLLLVETLTAHALRPTALVDRLAKELKVELRQSWHPDAAWLASFQKCQLAHLLGELCGPVYNPASENRKKSELVEMLAKLFADAAEGKLEDKKLAERVNGWVPASLLGNGE